MLALERYIGPFTTMWVAHHAKVCGQHNHCRHRSGISDGTALNLTLVDPADLRHLEETNSVRIQNFGLFLHERYNARLYITAVRPYSFPSVDDFKGREIIAQLIFNSQKDVKSYIEDFFECLDPLVKKRPPGENKHHEYFTQRLNNWDIHTDMQFTIQLATDRLTAVTPVHISPFRVPVYTADYYWVWTTTSRGECHLIHGCKIHHSMNY
jgi:hypothetical protein